MTVAVSNLHNNSVNANGSFDEQEKRTLRKVTDTGAGIIAVCTEQENGAATTTPANTNLRVNGLKAGRRYLVKANVLASNATVANGARITFSLTGTQTTAVTIGSLTASATTAFTTPAVVGFLNTAAGGSNSGAVLVNTAYAVSGAGGGSAVHFQGDFVVTPQNDGDLVVQLGSGTGSTQSRLDVGSVLQVCEITF